MSQPNEQSQKDFAASHVAARLAGDEAAEHPRQRLMRFLTEIQVLHIVPAFNQIYAERGLVHDADKKLYLEALLEAGKRTLPFKCINEELAVIAVDYAFKSVTAMREDVTARVKAITEAVNAKFAATAGVLDARRDKCVEGLRALAREAKGRLDAGEPPESVNGAIQERFLAGIAIGAALDDALEKLREQARMFDIVNKLLLRSVSDRAVAGAFEGGGEDAIHVKKLEEMYDAAIKSLDGLADLETELDDLETQVRKTAAEHLAKRKRENRPPKIDLPNIIKLAE